MRLNLPILTSSNSFPYKEEKYRGKRIEKNVPGKNLQIRLLRNNAIIDLENTAIKQTVK